MYISLGPPAQGFVTSLLDAVRLLLEGVKVKPGPARLAAPAKWFDHVDAKLMGLELARVMIRRLRRSTAGFIANFRHMTRTGVAR